MKVKFDINLLGSNIPIVLNIPSALENDIINLIEDEKVELVEENTPALTNEEFNEELICHLEDLIDREISKAESRNFEIVDPVKGLK